MELSRETVKRIKGLIVFAALVVACLWMMWWYRFLRLSFMSYFHSCLAE